MTCLNTVDYENREDMLKLYHAHFARVLEKLKWKDISTLSDVLQEYRDKFLDSIYSLSGKMIINSSNSSGQNMDDLINEKGRRYFRKG